MLENRIFEPKEIVYEFDGNTFTIKRDKGPEWYWLYVDTKKGSAEKIEKVRATVVYEAFWAYQLQYCGKIFKYLIDEEI